MSDTIGDHANRDGRPYAEWLADGVREAVQLLAGGARIEAKTGRIVTYHGELAGPVLDHLCHHGWLDSTRNGGSYFLSDKGRLSYLRSTDELGDGKLLDPTEFRP